MDGVLDLGAFGQMQEHPVLEEGGVEGGQRLVMSRSASSLPSDLVMPMTAALLVL